MRGDSLRDFYAKVLAVVGLGLLACGGAAVDYWPARIEPPLIASVQVLPQPATLVQRFDIQIPAPEPARPHSPAVVVARPPVVVTTVAAATEVPLGTPVPLGVMPAPLPLEPVVMVSASAVAVPPPFVVDSPDEPVPSSPVALDDQDNGFIGGAIRTTRDSIVRTGVVTGTSIAGAFRAFVGVFKKVNPF